MSNTMVSTGAPYSSIGRAGMPYTEAMSPCCIYGYGSDDEEVSKEFFNLEVNVLFTVCQ